MLQLEMSSRTSGQTAACRRLYSATLSAFSPIIMPMRCMSLAPDLGREFVNAAGLDGIPVPINADARLRWRDCKTVLDAHPGVGEIVELRNIFDILAVRHGAGQADMEFHEEVRTDRHVEGFGRVRNLEPWRDAADAAHIHLDDRTG